MTETKYPRGFTGNRVRLARIVFRDRRGENLRLFRGSEKAGARAETVHPVCYCKNRHYARYGTAFETDGDHARCDFRHYERIRYCGRQFYCLASKHHQCD